MENKCDEIKIDDGPIINDFCDEKRKCFQDSMIYFNYIIKQYIKDFFGIKDDKIFNICFILSIIFIFIIIYFHYNIDKFLLIFKQWNIQNNLIKKEKQNY